MFIFNRPATSVIASLGFAAIYVLAVNWTPAEPNSDSNRYHPETAMNVQKLIITSTLALAGATAASTTTRASEQGEQLTRTVTYADLDLARTAGAATLYSRISSAADQVCAPHAGRSPREFRQWRNCLDQTIDRAVDEMNNHVLTSYHLAKRGKPVTTAVATR